MSGCRGLWACFRGRGLGLMALAFGITTGILGLVSSGKEVAFMEGSQEVLQVHVQIMGTSTPSLEMQHQQKTRVFLKDGVPMEI